MSKISKSKTMKIIIIAVIIIIPVMYSFFYLKAFWDPYGNLKDMKIAVVNLDEGEKDENLGKQLLDNLKEEDVMTIEEMEEEQAHDALVNQECYAVISIPKDFTKTLNNAENADRKVATITYSPNQKNNYLASQIISKVVTSVETQLRGEVSQKVVTKLSDKLEEVPNKMEEISDGAKTIQEGTNTLSSGIQKLEKGTQTLSENYNKFDKGIQKSYQGSNDLKKGATQVASGVTQYVDTVNSSISNIAQTTSQVESQITQLGTNIVTYAKMHPEVAATPEFQKILGQLQEINQSSSGTSKMEEKITLLQAKGKELKQGATKVSQGVEELNSGLKTINNSSAQLKQGIDEIYSGAKAATAGTQELSKGITTYTDTIDNGIEDTKEQLTSLDGLDQYVKEPVEIEENDYGQIDSYGVGFAPYFMSISLWVGALVGIIIFYFDVEDRFPLLSRNATNKFLRSALYFIIAIAEGIVLGFILKLGLGFTVTNIWLYYGACILIALVFTSIIQFLVVNFGDVGKFLSILLLVLQLAASGGTFPIETIPGFFQAIYSYMPMNYTIRLIKEAIIKIDAGMIANNAWVLIGIFAVFLGITLLLDFIRTKKEHKVEQNS